MGVVIRVGSPWLERMLSPSSERFAYCIFVAHISKARYGAPGS